MVFGTLGLPDWAKPKNQIWQNEKDKRMLICNDAVFISGEGKKSYSAVVFSKPYFAFSESDKTEALVKKTKANPQGESKPFDFAFMYKPGGVKLEGSGAWAGTCPVGDFTSDLKTLPKLFGDAINHLTSEFGTAEKYKDLSAAQKGQVIVLSALTEWYDLVLRGKLQASERPKAAISEEKAIKKVLDGMIADSIARNAKNPKVRVLTLETATALRLKRIAEEEAEAA